MGPKKEYIQKYHHDPEQKKIIAQKLGNWEAMVMLLTIAFLVIGVFAYSEAGYFVYPYIVRFVAGTTGHVFLIGKGAFYIAGSSFSCAFVFLPVEFIQWVFMGNMYPVYNDYYSTIRGRNNRDEAVGWVIIMGTFSLVLYVAFATSFMSVNEQTFRLKFFYNLYPQTYKIKAVKGIQYYCYIGSEYGGTEDVFKLSMEDSTNFVTQNWTVDDKIVTKFVTELSKVSVAIDSMGTTKETIE